MRIDNNLFLQNKYVLYLFFIIVLLQLIVFLQCGNMYYAALLLLVGVIISYFKKNMIVVLFSTLIITHLVRWFFNLQNIKEGLDGENSNTSKSGAGAGANAAINMSSKDIKQVLEEQESKKKELASDINNLYLNNQKEIANLVVIKQQLENKQASIPT